MTPRPPGWPRSAARGVSLLLALFLAWRGAEALGRAPALTQLGGAREALSWSLEQRRRQVLDAASAGATSPAEAWRVLALIETHAEPRAVVLAQLGESRAQKRFGITLGHLVFPRIVARARDDAELESLRTLVEQNTRVGLHALCLGAGTQHAWSRGAELQAASESHELWRLPRRAR